MPDYPQEGAVRGGHIPGAASVPWARAAAEDATFKPRAELEAIYQQEQGLAPDDDVIAYCRIGERSSHTWFVLTHLLGFSTRAQLRRQLDRVGQRGAGADRHRQRTRLGAHMTLPAPLAELVEEFAEVGPRDRLQLLLELSRELPRAARAATPTRPRPWSRCRSASRRCSWPSR